MAKKKKRSGEGTNKKPYLVELKGLLLLLIAVIGLCYSKFGRVGKFFQTAAIFLVGEWWAALLFVIAIIGIYMMIRRSLPNLLNSKLIGLYIVALAILIMTSIYFVESYQITGINILKKTVENVATYYKDTNTIIKGGGIIGSAFTALFVWLFSSSKDSIDTSGLWVVCWVIFGCGIIMFTGISIYDIIVKLTSKIKSPLTRKHEKEIAKVEEEYEKDDKIVISSVDELIHSTDDKESKENVNIPLNIDSGETKEYIFPPLTILNKPSKAKNSVNEEAVGETVRVLEGVFKDFSIEGKVVAVNIGPSVTQYEMDIKAGTKVSKILSINREIALALGAKDVRIQAPIPGKKTVGVEIPNKVITNVTIREVLETVPSSFNDSKLLVTLGKDIKGKPMYTEINKTPHLLVAGATGSGKSVCINSFIVSILMRTRPDEVKLVLVDPKKVELSVYNGVPHLLAPVVTDPKKANIALKKIVSEMENRYDIFENSGTKNIAGYNAYVDMKNKSLGENEKIKKIPYIVVIIDELADLMLVAAKEVEDSIMRITQMARAAGIHLIVATQRPSTDVITGIVKANIPSRISFAVSSSIDSRTILDGIGAEKLLGKGDMLFLPQGENTPVRIQGTFVSDDEIKAVVDYVCKQQKARYDESLTLEAEDMNATTMIDNEDDYEEPLYKEIVEFVVQQQQASASLLQRRFRLGYNRAARAIDLLEDRGIVGPRNGSKPREVLVKLNNHNEE